MMIFYQNWQEKKCYIIFYKQMNNKKRKRELFLLNVTFKKMLRNIVLSFILLVTFNYVHTHINARRSGGASVIWGGSHDPCDFLKTKFFTCISKKKYDEYNLLTPAKYICYQCDPSNIATIFTSLKFHQTYKSYFIIHVCDNEIRFSKIKSKIYYKLYKLIFGKLINTINE